MLLLVRCDKLLLVSRCPGHAAASAGVQFGSQGEHFGAQFFDNGGVIVVVVVVVDVDDVVHHAELLLLQLPAMLHLMM